MVALSGAASTAEALRDFWAFARAVGQDGTPGQRALAFPAWRDAAGSRAKFQAIINYLLSCADLCEWVGDSILLSGRHPQSPRTEEEPESAPYPTLLLRTFRQRGAASWNSEYGEDPFAETSSNAATSIAGSVPDDETILAETRKWVEAVIVHMHVCPFAGTADRAGLPAGGVTYPITHASSAEEVYEQFWDQVHGLTLTDEREVSTVLLVTPAFSSASAGGYDLLADTLNAALTDLRFEEQVQLVFFHPGYTFRDGVDRIGEDAEGAAANFARRSPYPMINLLRTPQVRAAQKGIPTGSVYTTNERNLQAVGGPGLQDMLERRDWGGVYEKQFVSHEENTWK